MPDLVARLSGLHATLSTRLALQQSLLSLSGRLDMVISQIEMRSSVAPAPLPLPSKKSRKGKKKKNAKQPEISKYVEGQSSDDEQAGEVDVEVESGDDAGSVEDIELGGSDADEDSEDDGEEEEDDEDEDEDEDGDEGGGVKMNGFIDDEAEEFSGDEDDDESD
ncbi:hypothetical protein EUX98_g4003 [Antrodiella citrinella]|uniref:Small-subunit processome Utp12 domain-containing protein n=1 Tax=Antrodiella citrinella TaxID=2447956 RepID=A0A4S4N361_9APHY|nr:hypothetical protein EUX98_g4003 [Antrodiella citrinella]